MAGGYKGYGLSMMVDVLTGILSGALFGPHIRFWKGASRVANLVRSQVKDILYFSLYPLHNSNVKKPILPPPPQKKISFDNFLSFINYGGSKCGINVTIF